MDLFGVHRRRVAELRAWADERAVHIEDLDAADPGRLAPLNGLLAGKRLVFLGEADHFVGELLGFRTLLLQIAPQISVPDVCATAQWYCDVLGFSIDSIYPEDQPDAAVISRDEAAIVLDRSARGLAVPNHERHGVGYDAYISVDHLDELAREFRDRGARIIDGPVNPRTACANWSSKTSTASTWHSPRRPGGEPWVDGRFVPRCSVTAG